MKTSDDRRIGAGDFGEISNSQIEKAVTRIMVEMEDDGLVVEVGQCESCGYSLTYGYSCGFYYDPGCDCDPQMPEDVEEERVRQVLKKNLQILKRYL